MRMSKMSLQLIFRFQMQLLEPIKFVVRPPCSVYFAHVTFCPPHVPSSRPHVPNHWRLLFIVCLMLSFVRLMFPSIGNVVPSNGPLVPRHPPQFDPLLLAEAISSSFSV